MPDNRMINGRFVRHATIDDTSRIFEIFEYAREQMRKNGNPTQWGNNRPSKETILNDIENGDSYVIEVGGRIVGSFAFLMFDDPTYAYIEDGQWPNDEKYGVVHRIASDGTLRGFFETVAAYARERIDEAGLRNLRVDTHHDNKIMQHVVTKNGFERCGIVYMEDKSKRIAYQWIKK